MEWAALITWVVTALFGFAMLAIWLKHGGMQQRGISNLRPALVFSHFLLAAGGLVVWIIYLAADKDVLKWIAFAALAVVAVLGWTMFFAWVRQRSALGAPTSGTPPPEPPERRFPIPVVALHGLFAVTTVVLVFLTAIGVGD
jgi:manganese efflux pump family protein